MFFIISSREACLKILILVLVNLLCYVEIKKNDFFTIIYNMGHKNITRTYIKNLRLKIVVEKSVFKK